MYKRVSDMYKVLFIVRTETRDSRSEALHVNWEYIEDQYKIHVQTDQYGW